MHLLTLLLAATEEAHSSTPFYFVGGALAAFAVLVGAIGLARPDLGRGASNAIMGVGAALVLGTMVTIIAIS
jgi:hypothetical protein